MENKTSRYLKYAVGEVVLVMIGILLALQVNNWNEKRISKNNEIKLSKQLLSDARADSVFFESRVRYQKERDTLFNHLISLSNDNSLDSISDFEVKHDPFFFRLAYQSNLITNNPNAYDLISVNNIKDKLREYIKAYDYVVNAIELNNRICEQYGVPLQIKYYEQITKLSESTKIKDLMFAVNDNETMAKFDLFKSNGINYGIQCQEFLKVNHELLLLLESYLNSKND